MNHLKIYENIIQNAKNKKRIKFTYYEKYNKPSINYIYFEKHHIIPKCLNGSNDEINLVLLTAKEHYICHKLLTYIYPKNRKIALAFFRMTFDKRGKVNISARDYAYAKEHYASISMSIETRNKISQSCKGKKRSEEFKQKVSKGMKGVNVGKKHSEQSRTNMSKAHII